MRKYYITEWNLGYHVFRVDSEDEFGDREYLQNDTYTPHRQHARTFYNLDSAISALIISKCRWKKETSTTSTKKSESEGRKEKTSWSEF